jgi:GTP-binding protein
MPLAVAVVGRPNVGKSTLFNRLAGKQLAIVHDTPGVTRDRQDALAQLGSLSVRLIDTAGFDIGVPGSLSMRMTDQTLSAIKEADVCLFVVNARDGVTTGDEIIAESLRRSGKPVVLVANKCDVELDLSEFYALGLGEPIGVSAVHNLGTDEIVDALEPFGVEEEAAPEEPEPGEEIDRPLKLAIVGRPNVGKSSLFNRMLGEERSLTGPEAGLVRPRDRAG